ncbi:MAG: hypothetical protein ABIB71_00695 [Candidatus Woesearchaeota archaeon]
MTALGNAVQFLVDLGVFDVILPFLLVFTIVFGILEKTRIFGVEKIDEKEYPKKQLNAMVAFVIGFFTVAAKEIVQSLQISLPLVALMLTAAISFMLLVGAFMGDKQFNLEDHKFWKFLLMIIMFISIILIFLHSFGWLDPVIGIAFMYADTVTVPVLFFAVVIGIVFYVVRGTKKPSGGNE